MFLLIAFARRHCHASFYFNTSHVSINQRKFPRLYFGNGISIHLMFLLIALPLSGAISPLFISIHLMFLLIKKAVIFCLANFTISIHLMFLLIGLHRVMQKRQHNFNTSHVSINLDAERKRIQEIEFQYISCFY